MRIIGSILVTGVLTVIGFYAMLFAAFSGEGQFYMPFLITVAALAAIFSNLAICDYKKIRKSLFYSAIFFP